MALWHFSLLYQLNHLSIYNLYNGTQMALMALMALKMGMALCLKNGTHGTIVFLYEYNKIYRVSLQPLSKSAKSAI